MGPFYQPHGIILSYGYIPVNYIKRFYRLFVWIWRLYCGDLLSGRNTYIPSQTDSSLCIPPCTSIGMFCLRFTPVIAVLLQRFAFGSRLLFDAERQTGRLAVSCVSIPRGSGSPLERSHMLMRLSSFVGSLLACAFLGGDPDGATTGVGYTKRNAVFVQRSFCYKFMIRYDTAGRTLGLRAPDCAKESSTLWTLFTLRRGYVGANSRRRRPGTRKDLTGSNLWPVRSCCIAMLSVRTNVQTRSALKR